jgi:hypothetical protein
MVHKNVIFMEKSSKYEFFKKEFINKNGRMVCPECKNHLSDGDGYEFSDCKNLMLDDNDEGHVIGQCQCYSKEHGVVPSRYR